MQFILDIFRSYLGPVWEIASNFVNNYWELYMGWLPYNRLILYLLILLILGGPVFMLLYRVRGMGGKGRRPGKLASGRDIKKEAAWCEKNREFIRAGELYEQIEKYPKAIKMYQQGKSIERAARVYFERLNDFDGALGILAEYSAWELAGNLCAKAGRFSEAGGYYEKANKLRTAAESYEQAHEFGRAADLYEKSEFIEEAGGCYGQAGDFAKAAQFYERVWKQTKEEFARDKSGQAQRKIEDLAKKSAYFYKQGGDLQKSAEILDQAGIKKFAAELYLMAGDKRKAADIFHQLGALTKAAELYEQAGDPHKAAEIRAGFFMKQNDLHEAARQYELAGDLFAAADLHLRLGDQIKAADLYLHGGDSKTAAEVYYKAGEHKKAGEAYELSGNYEMAMEVYRQIKDDSRLSELYEKAGNYYEAAQSYYKAGKVDKAVVALTQVSEKSSDFMAALEFTGDIYMQMGKNEQALACYRRLAQKKPFNPENIDFYSKVAELYERAGQTPYALNLYQRIYQLAPHFGDVAAKIQSISQRMSGGISPGMASVGASGAREVTVAGAGAMGQSGGFRYQVVRELGRGGMGVVYLAKDINLGRQVAYKVLPAELKKHPEIVTNFIREAKSLAQLNHPYIVSIFDAGEHMGNYYIVMEYVEGENLKRLIGRSARIPIRIGIEIFKQLAQALDYAHSRKVIHRDIKPHNIMWTENQTIKVMDFGLAAILEEVKTGRTLVSGTPLYMSPEQCLGKPLDNRTDIYSAGASIYELFCKAPPFPDGDISYHHVHTPVRSVKEKNSAVPDELNRIILKCLSKDPEQRYQNGRELYLDLKMVEG